MPESRPRDAMLAREAIDEAFKLQVAAVFAIACSGTVEEAKPRLLKAINNALDMRQLALDVFVNGTKQV